MDSNPKLEFSRKLSQNGGGHEGGLRACLRAFKLFERDLASRVLRVWSSSSTVILESWSTVSSLDCRLPPTPTVMDATRNTSSPPCFTSLGDLLGTMNHSEYAASIIKPYVRPNTYWMIRQHGLFQGYYYFHLFRMGCNARDQYRGHPAHQMCLDFCDKYDEGRLDPDYDTMPLTAFVPMVNRLFAREPWVRMRRRMVAIPINSDRRA